MCRCTDAIARDVSYILWRAETHRLGATEIDRLWAELNEKASLLYPSDHACHIDVTEKLTKASEQFESLKKRPRVGLIGDL